jgi:hypothetical protein
LYLLATVSPGMAIPLKAISIAFSGKNLFLGKESFRGNEAEGFGNYLDRDRQGAGLFTVHV